VTNVTKNTRRGKVHLHQNNVLMKYVLFLMLLTATTIGCDAQTKQPAGQSVSSQSATRDVNAKEFHELMHGRKECLVIDVRTPQETAAGVLPGALKININDAAFDQQVSRLEREKPVFVYCRSGARSSSAMQKMKAMGFKEVYNLAGGIMAWQRAGYPVVKG
jgi:rhodanese-related sulfurtransferase